MAPSESPPSARRVTARALLLGDRIDASGLERPDTISSSPLAFHAGSAGFVAIFRFGVAVLVGLTPLEEEDFLAKIKLRVEGERGHVDDETTLITVSTTHEDRVLPDGLVQLADLTADRFLVVADALAKNVSLTRDEREVQAVFDIIEPFAVELSLKGRAPWKRRAMLRLIGQMLLVQHRVSGRAVEEKPDVLWDRHDLERLYARLEDEYELKERAGTLKRKLEVIVETARALTDIIDADRSTRLEITVVLLIVTEILITFYQMFFLRLMH